MMSKRTSKEDRVHKSEIVATIENERRIGSITWLPFESEMFTAAAYDADRQALNLRFRKTGDVYRDFELPASEYQAFLGIAWPFLPGPHPRGSYRYERMAKLRAA